MPSIRMRLFGENIGSPVVTSGSELWNETELEAVLTPCRRMNSSKDQDHGVSTELAIEIPARKRLPKKASAAVSRSLFSGKRPCDYNEAHASPMSKKPREPESNLSTSCIKETTSIVDAVDRLTTQEDLIADGSRDYCLPTIPGRHGDLKSISCDTMAEILTGCYSDQLEQLTIVDCRYPYEFEGGHIRGAVNMYTKDAVQSLLQMPVTSEKKHVLIFHCEFSSERGPKMYRFLRSQDRDLNKDSYPALNFPEVYLLDGGYKEFYGIYKDLCDPDSYKPMLHEEHMDDLRHFRVKSKSWTAGEKQKASRRSRSRLLKHSLEF